MKALSLLVLATFFTTPSFADVNRTPLSQLKLDTKDFLNIFESQTEVCDLRLKETRNGITISVKQDKAPVVYLDVDSKDGIKMKRQVEEDGSYSSKYTINGEAKIEFVHVDDAYDHFYVTKDGKTTSCELDY